MKDYEFRFRKKDWTNVDAKKLKKKIRKATKKGLKGDEFLAEVGMTYEEAIEFLSHHLDTNFQFFELMEFLLGIEYLGFDQNEIYYIGEHLVEFTNLLRDHYNGPDFEDIEDAFDDEDDEQILKTMTESRFFPILSGGDEPIDPATEKLMTYFIEAGLTDGQVTYIFMMPDKFVTWGRNHMDF